MAIVLEEDFEVGVGEWTIGEPTFEQSSDYAHGGEYSGKGNNAGGDDSQRANYRRTFARQTAKVKVTIYIRIPVAGDSFYLYLLDGAASPLTLLFLNGDITYYDGEAYQDTGLDHSTVAWDKLELELDLEANTISIKLNDVAGTCGYRIADPEGVDTIYGAVYKSSGSHSWYWDDISIATPAVGHSFGFIMG